MWAGCRQYLLQLAAVRRSGKLPQVPLSGQARYGTDHPWREKSHNGPQIAQIRRPSSGNPVWPRHCAIICAGVRSKSQRARRPWMPPCLD